MHVAHTVQLNVTAGLIEGQYACPGMEIIFSCETRGSTAIAWSSDVYVGLGGAQLVFGVSLNSEGSISTSRDNSDTMATLIFVDRQALILESTLRIIATSNSLITCTHTTENINHTINFKVLEAGK